MRKRVWSILLAVCMVLVLLPATALAANVLYSGRCGANASWVITDDGVMTISGTGTVTAPMDQDALFQRYNDFNKVVIQEGITSIGVRAFSANYPTKALVLPNSLKTIEDYGFYGNEQLEQVQFGSGLVSLGEEAFSACRNLKAIDLPDSLQSIGIGAFSNCSALEEVVVPGSVKTVKNGAFHACTSLKTAAFMDGVQTLEPSIFTECGRLEDVYLPDTILSIGGACFYNCTSLTGVRLPAKLTVISNGLFGGCTALEHVIIPGTVQKIEEVAFGNCDSLSALYYAGTEDMLGRIQIEEKGNWALAEVDVYLIPAMPDPVFGFFDLPARGNWAYDGIAFCLMTGLMDGVRDGYFDPGGTTTRAQLVTILWRMMDEPKASRPAPFADLTQGWYRDAVAWAAENNITDGTSDTTFSPNDPVTREQMVTIFHRMCRDYLEIDVSPSASLAPFPDNGKVSAWAKDAMQWAVAVKLITGVGDGRGNAFLEPRGKATRAQIATVMLNFYNAFAEE